VKQDFMKTIAVVSQKGGSGKSTIAVHLAVAAHRAGLVATIIDLDSQGTAACWGDDRGDNPPEFVSGQASRLTILLDTARKEGFDLVVIDTGPAADVTARRAAEAADLVIIPCRPSTFDLRAAKTSIDLTEIVRAKAFVVLNAAPRGRIVEEARDVVVGLGGRVVPVAICQRAAFVHSVINGRTAMEFEPDGKAAEEIAALWQWAAAELGLPAKAAKAA
jgi:chromosome partitioning protein